MAFDSQGGANALGAIQDAIGMYMGLREKKYDRDRQAQSDARADRALSIQEDAAKSDIDASQRRSVEFLVSNFGGQQASPEDAAQARKLGYGSSLEERPAGLPSSRPALPINYGLGEQQSEGMASPINTIAQRMAGTPGGTYFKMPESEKSRIAAYNAQTHAYEGEANRGNRLEVANIGAGVARDRIALQKQIAGAVQALTARGQDMGSLNQQRGLMQRAEEFGALLDDRTYDNYINMLRSNPLMAFQMMQQGGVTQPPNLQIQPQPFSGGAGVGGSDWEVMR